MSFDAVIIGGSYAGMAAGLQLARARRKILLIDAGQPRNRFASHSHGFLTQDGAPPAEIAAEARSQLMEYPTVEWRTGRVEAVTGTADNFLVALADGSTYQARRIILAAGVTDELPGLPGLAELWGKRVFHCPYCHGYELGKEGIGVLATSELAMHHGLMLPDWGATTLFVNDAFDPSAEQLAQLKARGTHIEYGAAARLVSQAEVGVELVMQDGRVFPLMGLFVAPRIHLTPLIAQVGCELEESLMGSIVKTDAMQATSIPGVFACGDVARAAGSVTFAVADGAMAGLSTHRSLMFGY
ncbi:NAD(P)/FAD-dependent oxidoreductase [Halomonas sp. QX-2]|jgi:thioredoxin reductase|uniref:NAD(P)/FAD-dependent oxidoreductase n=1 Tax=Vreelandella sedimenti TaxID=2729618 RepID=A0A7Z0N7Y1_9GAMM|nr:MULTISPECIES: NAD(P)/FAD-dependent oxidoreductase [Halomonas]NYT73318.1 NAD(P)/FAD-dependent oxidoreductase [Halomonas sedimenti]|tara:strand:- start:32951 stop:33847 length:897 start_codon:yes stop_codon:yes gene_type:complete